MRSHSSLALCITLLIGLSACGRSTDGGPSGPNAEALLEVAEQGDLSGLNALLARSRTPDVRDSCDWTPLMKAALNGHLEVAERLLQAGAAVDAKDKGGYTAMMLAASNNHARIVEILLDRGAAVDHQEATKGWTALIWAAKLGHAKAVGSLLRQGADATLKDFDGKTAGDWAREAGHGAVLDLITSSQRPAS